MTYHQLVSALAGSTRLQKKQVGKLLRQLSLVVVDEARAGRKVLLPDLGVFRLGHRAGRVIRNPSTKELQTLPALKTLSFRASKSVKAAVAR